MTMKPKRSVVLVPLVQQGQDKVFEITVVRRGDKNDAVRLKESGGQAWHGARIIEMLDDLRADNDVKLADPLGRRFIVDTQASKRNIRVGKTSLLNSFCAWIATYHGMPRFPNHPTETAVSTAQIEHTLRL